MQISCVVDDAAHSPVTDNYHKFYFSGSGAANQSEHPLYRYQSGETYKLAGGCMCFETFNAWGGQSYTVTPTYKHYNLQTRDANIEWELAVFALAPGWNPGV